MWIATLHARVSSGEPRQLDRARGTLTCSGWITFGPRLRHGKLTAPEGYADATCTLWSAINQCAACSLKGCMACTVICSKCRCCRLPAVDGNSHKQLDV